MSVPIRCLQVDIKSISPDMQTSKTQDDEPQRIAVHQRPHIPEAQAITIGIGIHIRVVFKVVDDIVYEAIDVALIRARLELLIIWVRLSQDLYGVNG
jgi:hypothetical protein